MDGVTDLTYGAPIEAACIDCGEPLTVDPLTDDPATARCPACAYEALPADVKRMAANQLLRGYVAAARAKAESLTSHDAASAA